MTTLLRKLQLVPLIAAVAVVPTLSAVSEAAGPVPRADAAAIRAVVHTHWVQRCSHSSDWPTGKIGPFVWRGAKVSAVDRRYGLGLFADNGCTYSFGDIVRRPTPHSEHWTVIGSIADSAEPCAIYRKRMPEKVVHDFRLKGVVSTNGRLVVC